MAKGPVQPIRSGVSYSFLKILTGSDLSTRRLALMRSESGKPGPTVWLTGCMHGDEVGGIVVIQEIFRQLKKQPLKKGNLFAFPMMNPIGFETASRHIGLSKEDLNRAFPGNPDGSLAERMAHRIFSTIIETSPALVMDLHNDWIKSIPYVLLEPDALFESPGIKDKVMDFALGTGFLAIAEPAYDAHVEELKHTLTGSLVRRGVPSFTIELGESFVVNERNVEDGVRAVLAVLSGLDMAEPAEGEMHYRPAEGLCGKVLEYSHRPASSSSGIVRFLVKPGDLVKKGQKIARIYNVFGKLQQTLTAESDAIVLGHADTSVALPGAPAVAFGRIGD